MFKFLIAMGGYFVFTMVSSTGLHAESLSESQGTGTIGFAIVLLFLLIRFSRYEK